MSDSLFDSNSADEGGAFLAFGNVQLSVSSNLFTRNRASESGGALALTGAVSGVLQNSTFENCQVCGFHIFLSFCIPFSERFGAK